MNQAKMLSDLIDSATGAKTHYDVWWAQVSEAKSEFAEAMSRHSDFFRASQDAHYTAFFVYLAHLFDKRPDSSSLQNYLSHIRASADSAKLQDFEARYTVLAERAAPLVTVRHKTVAHIDARLSGEDVVAPLNITWNEVRAIVHDVAAFVELLAGALHQGALGIPRDGRLGEATLRLIKAIQ